MTKDELTLELRDLADSYLAVANGEEEGMWDESPEVLFYWASVFSEAAELITSGG